MDLLRIMKEMVHSTDHKIAFKTSLLQVIMQMKNGG